MLKSLLAALATIAIISFMSDVPAAAESPRVKFTTNHGEIVIELYPDKALVTVENFLKYVASGHYAGTVFHRVIRGFMIQGGGFEPGLNQKGSGSPIENEAFNGLKNSIGAIAMARTGDPHSATAQFFINTANNANLDHTGKNPRGWGYAVFGMVVEGLDVVKKIEGVATHTVGQYGDVPQEDVVIEKAETL